MKLERASRSLLAMAIIATLSACGGGGGGGDNNSPPPQPTAQTGTFEFGNVEGINYTSPSYSGTTNAQGQFNYKTGEQITFSVAGVDIGTVAAAPSITLFDLFNVAKPTNEAELKTFLHQSVFEEGDAAAVVNLAGLLLILDDDISIENGLKIPDFASYSNTLPPPINFTKSGFEFQFSELKPVLELLNIDDVNEAQILNITKALNVLVEESDIAFPIVTPKSFTTDYDGDGVNDYEKQIYFNNDGKLVGYQTGDTNTRYQIHYGEYGEFIGTTEYFKETQAVPSKGSAAASLVTTPEFDVTGYEKGRVDVRGLNMLGELIFYSGQNGNIYKIEYFTSEDGNTTKEIYSYTVSTEGDVGEGVFYGVGDYREEETVVRNENGQRITNSYEIFVNNVKVYEGINFKEYNDQYTLISEGFFYDQHFDGNYERYALTTYNGAGNKLSSESYTDRDQNGIYESYSKSTYSEYGELTRQTSYEEYEQTDDDPEYEYHRTMSFEYNDELTLVHREDVRDQDGDGIYEYMSTLTTKYDESGLVRTTEEARDENGDQAPEYSREFIEQLDEQGLVTSSENKIDSNGDGTIDSTASNVYTRFATGNIKTRYESTSSGIEGSITNERWWEYDENNNLIYEERRLDNNRDGLQEVIYVRNAIYNANRQVEWEEVVSGSAGLEGVLNTITTINEWDGYSKIFSEITQDFGSDGVIDRISGSQYSERLEEGVRITQNYSYSDTENDGVHDKYLRFTRHYDGDDNLILVIDRDKNYGSTNRNTETVYTDSTNGALLSKAITNFNSEDVAVSKSVEFFDEFKSEANGALYLKTFEIYDPTSGEIVYTDREEFNLRGQRVSKTRTENVNGDSSETQSSIFTYNAAGFPETASVQQDTDLDGVTDYVVEESFIYNDNLDILSSVYRVDAEGDGEFETEISTDYVYEENGCLSGFGTTGFSNEAYNISVSSECETLADGVPYLVYDFVSKYEDYLARPVTTSLKFISNQTD